MSNLQEIKQQTLNFWSNLGKKEKIIIVGSAVLLFVSILAWSFWWGSRPDYVPLFTRLEAKDAGEIVNKLKDMKVPYEIGQNGTTILVPSKDVYQTRLQLASMGLPRGGVVGFEIFEQSKFGATEFDKKVHYLQALQGELTRTIEQMAEVEKARVHIVLPQDSLYKKDEKPATASVMLKLKQDAELSKDQMKGIIHLVASSVQGLKHENITLVDNTGNILYDINQEKLNENNNVTKITLAQMELQKKFQKDLEHSLQTLLEQVLGQGRVVARVSAELNFDNRVIEKKLFEPVVDDKGIVRSMQELNEMFKGNGSVPGGIPGTTSNIPGYVATDKGETQYEKREVTRNYEINEIKEQLVASPGSIKRLTVAVFIDGEMTPEQQESIAKVVGSAVGINPARGDVVSVTSLLFPSLQEAKRQQAAQAAAKARQQQMLLWAVGAVLAGGLGFILYRRYQIRRKLAEEAAEAAAAAAAAEAALLREQAEHVPDVEELSPEELSKLKIREQIEKLAIQKPEEVAQLMKTWLVDEE